MTDQLPPDRIFVYLRFSLAKDSDRSDFERDLRSMAQRAQDRLGYVSAEMGPTMDDPSVYVVVSEWDSVDGVRAWEHEPVHVEIQHKWEPHFREPLIHRRFTPWQRSPEP